MTNTILSTILILSYTIHFIVLFLWTGLEWSDEEWYMFLRSPLIIVVVPCIIVLEKYSGNGDNYDRLKYDNTNLGLLLFYLTRIYFLVVPLLIMWLIIELH